MSHSSGILWKKEESIHSDLYVELFAGRGYDVHLIAEHFDVTDLERYSDKTAHHWMHTLDGKSVDIAENLRLEGKLLYGECKYFDAMKKFNRALKLAPNDSEELGLAYANRSLCFFRLNMLEECLIDVEMAKKSNYPKHLMHKLHDRSVMCSNLLNANNYEQQQLNAQAPVLSFDEHEDFAGVANCLDIESDDIYGNHVVTTIDLEIGQTILVERAHSIVDRNPESKGRDRCMHCFKECTNLIPCKMCVNGLFCNEKCMNESFHKFHCTLWIPEPDKIRFRLVMEMFFRMNAAFSDFNDLMKTLELLHSDDDDFPELTKEQIDFAMILQVAHNHEKKTQEQLDTLKTIANHCFNAVIRSIPYFKGKFVELKKRRFLQHLMLHLCHISKQSYYMHELVFNNDHTKLLECTFNGYGSAIFAFGNYINHSCVPNVYWICVDNRLVCKVIRPIKKGEQIFRCYS